MREHQELVDGSHEENPVRRPPAAGLLGLQQAAGNHAVTHLVQRMKRLWNAAGEPDEPDPPHPTAPSGQQAPGRPAPTPGPTPTSTPTPTTTTTPGPPPKKARTTPDSATATTTSDSVAHSSPANLFHAAVMALPPLVELDLKMPRTTPVVPTSNKATRKVLRDREARRVAALAKTNKRLFRDTLEHVLAEAPQRKSEKKGKMLYQCGICKQYTTGHHQSADHKTPWSKVVAADFEGYVKPDNAHKIQLIYNDLDNLRPACFRCNSMRNADHRPDREIAEEVAPRRMGAPIPSRAVKELASTMTSAQLALAYQYMLAIKAGTITEEPTTAPTTDDATT